MDINMDVNKIVERIADGLGVATERVYPVLRQQAVIEGWYSLFWGVFFLLLLTGCVYGLYRLLIHINNKGDIEEVEGVFFISLIIFTFIIFLLTIMIGIPQIRDAFTAFYNPDYYIIEEIIRQIK